MMPKRIFLLPFGFIVILQSRRDLMVPRIITSRRPPRESIGRHPRVGISHSLLLLLREVLPIYYDVPTCFAMTLRLLLQISYFHLRVKWLFDKHTKFFDKKQGEGSSNSCGSVMNQFNWTWKIRTCLHIIHEILFISQQLKTYKIHISKIPKIQAENRR
jgi:hypothetical protein